MSYLDLPPGGGPSLTLDPTRIENIKAHDSYFGERQVRVMGELADYRFEMTDDDHAELAELLRSAQGYVVLSGYPSELYEELYGGWHRVERKHLADGASERTEVLWLSPKAAAALDGGLFGGVA